MRHSLGVVATGVHQARFLVLQEARDSLWSPAVLAAAMRDLPTQWENVFDYRPLLAETSTDPEMSLTAIIWQALPRPQKHRFPPPVPSQVPAFLPACPWAME